MQKPAGALCALAKEKNMMRQFLFAGRRHCGGHHKFREEAGFMGGPFGVRLPLRHLASRLNLDEAQVAKLAEILNELKTERAQAEVDSRRTLSAFADAVAGEQYLEAKAREASEMRVKTAERLGAAVEKALREIHSMLSKEQREKIAYLIRTGELLI